MIQILLVHTSVIYSQRQIWQLVANELLSFFLCSLLLSAETSVRSFMEDSLWDKDHLFGPVDKPSVEVGGRFEKTL